jgi:hypothetical protein
MTDNHRSSIVKWWALLAAGTAAVLLISWLARLAGLQLHTLLSIVAGALALGWLILLVAVPWNLYFAARGVVAQMRTSRARGIRLREQHEAEARKIARRMLGFAIGGHVVTAAATAAIAYATGTTYGYYLAGTFLLSAVIRPALAYFSHLRERIGALTRESLHPRDDVVSLREEMRKLAATVRQQATDFPRMSNTVSEDLRRAQAQLAGDISHARQLFTTDLNRLQDAQAADRRSASARAEELSLRIDRMSRQIEDTLDGISDHQELQTGLRALIRMMRTDAPA